MGNGVLSKPLKGQLASQPAAPKAASSAPSTDPDFTFSGTRPMTDERRAKDGDLSSLKTDQNFADVGGGTKREVVADFREIPEVSDRRIQHPAAEFSCSRDTSGDEKEKRFRTSLYEDLSSQGTAIWPGVGGAVAAVPAEAAADPWVGPTHPPHTAFYQPLTSAPARNELMFQTSEAGTSAGGDSDGGEEAEKQPRPPSLLYIAGRGGGSGTALSSGPGCGVDATWSISSDAGSAGANLESLDLYSASVYGCSGYGYGAAGGGAASCSIAGTAGGSDLVGTLEEEEADLEGVLCTEGRRQGGEAVSAISESPPGSLVTPFNIPDQLRLAEQHYERLQRRRKGAAAAAAAAAAAGDGAGRGNEAAALLDPPTEEIPPAQLAALKPHFRAATATATAAAAPAAVSTTQVVAPEMEELASCGEEEMPQLAETLRRRSSMGSATVRCGLAACGAGAGEASADAPKSDVVVDRALEAARDNERRYRHKCKEAVAAAAAAAAALPAMADLVTTEEKQQPDHAVTVVRQLSSGSTATAPDGSGDLLGGPGRLNSAHRAPLSGGVVREAHKAQEEDQRGFDALVRDGGGGTAIASPKANSPQLPFPQGQTLSAEASEIVGSGASGGGGGNDSGGVDAGDDVRASADLTHRHPSLEDVERPLPYVESQDLNPAMLYDNTDIGADLAAVTATKPDQSSPQETAGTTTLAAATAGGGGGGGADVTTPASGGSWGIDHQGYSLSGAAAATTAAQQRLLTARQAAVHTLKGAALQLANVAVEAACKVMGVEEAGPRAVDAGGGSNSVVRKDAAAAAEPAGPQPSEASAMSTSAAAAVGEPAGSDPSVGSNSGRGGRIRSFAADAKHLLLDALRILD